MARTRDRPRTERALALLQRRALTVDDVASALSITRTQAWHAVKELRRNGRVGNLAPGLYRAVPAKPTELVDAPRAEVPDPVVRPPRDRRPQANLRVAVVLRERLAELARQRGETLSGALEYLLDVVPTDLVRLGSCTTR